MSPVEIVAAVHMRDRIADMLEREADARDKRTPIQKQAGLRPPSPKAGLLFAMSRVVRAMQPEAMR